MYSSTATDTAQSPSQKEKRGWKGGEKLPPIPPPNALELFFSSLPLIPLSKVAFKAGRGEESGLRYDWAKCFPPLTERRFCLSVRPTAAAESVFFAPLTLRNGLEKRGGGRDERTNEKGDPLFPFLQPPPSFLSFSFFPALSRKTHEGRSGRGSRGVTFTGGKCKISLPLYHTVVRTKNDKVFSPGNLL